MSVNPVQGIGPASDVPFANVDHRHGQSHAPAPDAAGSPQTDLGPQPKPEGSAQSNGSASEEMPQDEVQVQRAGATNGEIVIRYVDHSGSLILQVPSSQVLNLARAIDQDLQEQAEGRENANVAPASGRGTTHGH